VEELSGRLGGLILAGFDGTTVSDETLAFIAGTAGAVLFRRNIASSDQTRALADALQSARPAGRPPLLIAIDQEGGPVQRLEALGVSLPSAMALGAAGDTALTREVYRTIGIDLHALGITLDFAPDADVNTDPDNPAIGLRSFGGGADAVSANVVAAVLGLRDAGIVATAKHFPGHGGSATDSHVALAVVRKDEQQLRAVDLAPFGAAIAAGVDVVMAGHIAAPALDSSSRPATQSPLMLGKVLRDELGFQGVICTDDLEMQALGDQTIEAAAEAALAAGADLLLFAHVEQARRALAAVRDALSAGRLDAQRIEASLARVDALRSRAEVLTAAAQERAVDRVAFERDRAVLVHDVARRSVTLIRSRAGVPPLDLAPGSRVLVVNFIEGGPAKSTGARVESALGKAIAAAGFHATEQLRDLDPAGLEYKQLLMAAGTADAFVALTRRAFAHPLQARAVADLALFGKPVVVVIALEPYDASHLPDEVAVIASFGDGDVELEAAAAVVLGRAKAQGRLPVALADAPHAVPSV
jgi:beta-N-acetylhexosaminidase